VSEQDQCPKCSEAVAVRTEDYITYGCASIGHVDGSFAQSNYCKARAELQASQQREADYESRIAELEDGPTLGPVKVLWNARFSGSEDFPYMVALDYGVGPCTPNVMCCRMSKENAEYVAAMWNSHDALVAACRAALRIERLWLPEIASAEHENEIAALHAMRHCFLAALSLAGKGEG
jgi:hypothetical protein